METDFWLRCLINFQIQFKHLKNFWIRVRILTLLWKPEDQLRIVSRSLELFLLLKLSQGKISREQRPLAKTKLEIGWCRWLIMLNKFLELVQLMFLIINNMLLIIVTKINMKEEMSNREVLEIESFLTQMSNKKEI